MKAQKIGERGQRLGNVVKDELWTNHGYCRKSVEMDGPIDLTVGQVLGQVTADDSWVVSAADAADGSEVPAGIVVEDISIASGDTEEVAIMYRGPAVIGDDSLILDESWDGSEADVYAAFEALGIVNRVQV